MGKVIKKKIQGMNWLMKTSLVLLLTLTSMVFMYEGWYKPKQAQAAITVLTNPTNVYTNATTLPGATGVTFAVGGTAGTRMLAVLITAEGSASGALSWGSVTYGGQAMTLLGGDGATSLSEHSMIYYLKDNAVMNGSVQTLAFNSPTNGMTLTKINVRYAVFDGVDQAATPVVQNYNSGATGVTTAAFGAALAIPANGQAILAATSARAAAAVSWSAVTNWTRYNSQATGTTGLSFAALRVIPGTATNDTHSVATITSSRVSMTGMAMAPVVATGGTLAVSTATQTVAEAVGNATVSVTRTGGTTGAVTVDYITANGTALAGQDYTSTTGTLSWAAGDATAKTITVPITNDTYDEGNETFTVTLSNATNGATLGTAVQTISITDDDTTPTIGFSAATSSGSRTVTPAVFTVNLSAASGLATSVNFATANGTASAGTDYTNTSGTLNIPALSTSGTINVPINAASAGGTFTITLSSPTNATLGTTIHTFTITAVSSTIQNCNGCHGYTTTFADGTARNTPAGLFQGSHNQHVITSATACSVCHTAPATTTSADFSHANGTVTMAPAINGGTYVKGSFAAANSFTPSTCNATTCHGTTSTAWGTNTTQSTCTVCHGVNLTTQAAYTATPNTAAPGYNGTGQDTAGLAVATGAKVGAHDTHLRGLNAISSPVACIECHTVPATSGAAGHTDSSTPAEVVFGTLAASGTGTAPGYVSGTGTCSNTYCHYGRSASYAPPATTNGNVVWNNTAYMSGTDTAAADCGKCHASPPLSTGTHAGGLLIADCNGCHSHVNTNGTFNNAALHINGIVEASGECITCHNAVVNSPIAGALPGGVATRPNAVAPFLLASNHKRSGGSTVTNEDCCVCHMEGDVTTGSAVPAYHKNGYIELRDPDLGTTIKGVTWANVPAGAGQYNSTATDARPIRFSRNLGNGTIEADTAAIMINLCLKCHDALGATSATARVPLGIALKPFNTTVAANPSGGVLNVASQFATSNRSYHPVMGKQNNARAGVSLMIAPWNTVTKTGTTTVWGPLISCWDCHAPSGATGTLTTSGIHGGAVTAPVRVPLRGQVNVTGTTTALNLCKICHVATTTFPHNAGSAQEDTTSLMDNGMTYYADRCYFCHTGQSTTSGTQPARPIGAGDSHGFSTKQNGTAFAAVNSGYGFVRSNVIYAAYTHTARSVGGTTYATATCGGASCRNSMDGAVILPGGVY